MYLAETRDALLKRHPRVFLYIHIVIRSSFYFHSSRLIIIIIIIRRRRPSVPSLLGHGAHVAGGHVPRDFSHFLFNRTRYTVYVFGCGAHAVVDTGLSYRYNYTSKRNDRRPCVRSTELIDAPSKKLIDRQCANSNVYHKIFVSESRFLSSFDVSLCFSFSVI